MALSNDIKFYYSKQNTPVLDNSTRIVPAPLISISPEIYYSNDSVVGYTYNITLNGYANAIRDNERPTNDLTYEIDNVISHMDHIRDVFSYNGGNIYIQQGNNNAISVEGVTLKSINFNQSNNLWTQYSPFTIELECNEVNFSGCVPSGIIQACTGSFFHPPAQTQIYASTGLIDFAKYKIKSFNDSWTFDIDETIHNNYVTSTTGIYNNTFKISYTLSAVGKNVYVKDKIIPAWEQAKLFCQYRLYTQASGLFKNVLQQDTKEGDTNFINPKLEIKDLYTNIPISGTSGIFSLPEYRIYNESINCETSESDGSFSVTYNATAKKFDKNYSDSENAAFHTFTQNVNHIDNEERTTSINVEGTVTGLIPGGFIHPTGLAIARDHFTLPSSGNFILKENNSSSTYSNAKSSFLAYIKSNNSNDLSLAFKTLLDISNSGLNLVDNAGNFISGKPDPTSFVVDHNFSDGIINYTANYDTKNAITSKYGYSNITISRKYPITIFKEFVIPGRANGPIIQKLGTKENGKISITVEGVDLDNISSSSYLSPITDTLDVNSIAGLQDLINQSVTDDYIKTKSEYTKNAIDGSFVINLEFLCKKI
jgi:hypothetical protein